MRPIRMLITLSMTASVATALAMAFSSGPDPRLTGGFKEGTCVRCHSSFPLNEGRTLGGIFKIEGEPRNYEPGVTYTLTVIAAHPGQSRWGFQLSARSADSGSQAGSFAPLDSATHVQTEDGIEYISHTEGGTRKGVLDGPVEFRFTWTAPSQSGGMVIFNAAGNAANGNGNQEGDYIYTAGSFTRPAGTARPVTTAARSHADRAEPARLSETSRMISLPVPVDLKQGSMEILIQHRFFQSITDSGIGDAIGIDSGANINLGFNLALTDRFSAGIMRTRVDKIVALTGAYKIPTGGNSRVKMSLLGGVEGQQNFRDHYSPYLQWAASVDYWRLRFQAVPTIVFNSRNDDLMEFLGDQAINPGSNHTFALGVGADIALTPRLSLMGEYVPRLAGFGGFGRSRPQVGGGLAIRTWGHVFTVLVSGSRDFTPSKYSVNAETTDVAIGFNIYRRIR